MILVKDSIGSARTKFLAIAFLVIAVCAAGGLYYVYRPKSASRPLSVQDASVPEIKEIQSVEGRYLFNGTVTWARAVEQQARGDFAQPFSMLNTFERDKYDAWSVDFECPITKNTVPYQTQITNLVFNCRPEFLPAATKYFNIFDLANNHTADQAGEQGLAETRQHLQSAGAQYFGTYDPGDSPNVCEVLALPVRIRKSESIQEKSVLPVAFCGFHYFNRPDVRPGEIEIINRYARVMPVFAFAEMGAEYQAKASSSQVEIARHIIDQGAEFLIANNPHWVQNTEVYNGKLIVYSTGNFIFDQLDSETNRSASIDLSLSVAYDDNVGRWLGLAPSCAAFHDDCLERAEKLGLKKIKLLHKYDVVAGLNGYKVITHKADPATQSAVEQRMNWSETLKALGQQ